MFCFFHCFEEWESVNNELTLPFVMIVVKRLRNLGFHRIQNDNLTANCFAVMPRNWINSIFIANKVMLDMGIHLVHLRKKSKPRNFDPLRTNFMENSIMTNIFQKGDLSGLKTFFY